MGHGDRETTGLLGQNIEKDDDLFGVADDDVKQLCTDFGSGELKGTNNLAVERHQEDDTVLDEDGQRRHRQMLGM